MAIYLAFGIPVLFAIALFTFYKHRTEWWEVSIPVVATIIFILIAKAICVHSLTTDTEWLGGYVTDVRYYEEWDEEVPCRHPRYCTSCSGSGKTRSCRTYVCGHYHSYDVDNHPEHWTAETTLGSYNISQSKYNQLVDRFGTGKLFVDMNRDYHSIDGDMYKTNWGGEDLTLEPVAQSESYENRPKASHSIYHYIELDSFDLKQYKPFEYPPITSPFTQKTLLGVNDPAALQQLQVVNSKLGASKQVRVFLLVFENQIRDAGNIQERYWQGGNMNEIVVCVGVDSQKNIQWGHVFSWTEKAGVKIKIRNEIESEKTLDLSKVIKTIEDEINFEWKRKDFHEFDYLNIDPTINQIIIIYILVILVNCGMAWWIIENEFNSDGYGSYKYRKPKKFDRDPKSLTDLIKQMARKKF